MTAVDSHAVSIATVFTCLLVLLPRPAGSQEPDKPTIHWAYSSFFGSGWYEINNERSAFILRIAPRWAVGAAGIDENDDRTAAWTIRVPVTIGVEQLDFDDIGGIVEFDNLTTTSASFGIDVDIPLTERYSVRPIVEAGYGTVLDNGDSAWTYRTEIRSRYLLPSTEVEQSLLFGLGFVGYEPNKGRSDAFTFAWAGAEFGVPVRCSGSDDNPMMFYWYLSYTDFLDDVSFSTGSTVTDSIVNYWQLGAAFGHRDGPLRFWFLRFDRLGLAFNFSTAGESRGVKLIFRSLYDP